MLWVVSIAIVSCYSLTVMLALTNCFYICALRIKKKLIIALYIFCIGKEASALAWCLAFTINPEPLMVPGTSEFIIATVEGVCEFAVVVIVILTNY